MKIKRIIKTVSPQWTRPFGGKSKKENGFQHKATQPTTASPLFLALFSALIAACGQGEATIIPANTPSNEMNTPHFIIGAAQKGPFIKGTHILINRLTAQGEATFDTTLSETVDDLGNFKIPFKATGPILIEADGVHFNEVTGQLSQSRLQLRAIYNVINHADQRTHINVLTHLAYGRILKLIRTGTPVADAIKRSESAVIDGLRPALPIASTIAFSALSLFDTDPSQAASNGNLLALSATLYQAAILLKGTRSDTTVEAEMTQLLNTLATYFTEIGRIDDPVLIAVLKKGSMQLRPDEIRANLTQRSFAVAKVDIPVANLDSFIDTDGDGLVNDIDTDDDGDGIDDAFDVTPYLATRILAANTLLCHR